VKSKYQELSELLCSLWFRQSDLEMPNEADSENAATLEFHQGRNYEFLRINSSLLCYNKKKIMRKQLLNKLQQNIRKSGKQ
jgi:hypothetical protein